MPRREDTPRVSIAQVRTRFKPSTYRALTRVTLDHAGVACEVELVVVPAHGSVRAPQRRLVCPRCSRAVLVLGVVEGKGWVCVACGCWRSRDRPRSVVGALSEAPLSPPATAPACGSASSP
jgi:hypothetical protein